MIDLNYNPDVLTCLANLSNDEVFTPPSLVNDILDLLPKEVWEDKTITFLDPVSKTGVFLREITKRLMMGLESVMPNKQKRINHILKNQVYGIGITEITSLLSRRSVYCAKIANSKYSICDVFDNGHGNIIFHNIQHSWKNEKCSFCGASEEVHKRDEELETHAYEFIHTNNPKELFNMKFDVIVGNPPYQLSTGGSGKQAKPLYNLFVEQAKKLNPKYLIMIIPARWYSGGFGLKNFRESMLNDKRIKALVDYPSSSNIFPGVDIAGGICYFLWEKDYSGLCEVTNVSKELKNKDTRPLNEFDIFIRYSKSVSIVRKIQNYNNKNKLSCLNKKVLSIGSFGLPTNYLPKNTGTPCQYIRRIGLQFANPSDITDVNKILNKWKVLIPKAPIAGQTDFTKPIGIYHDQNIIIIEPDTCCTDSWIVAGSFDTKEEAKKYKMYLLTKLVRFLILQTIISQDVNKQNFMFVPDIEKYNIDFTDDILKEKWDILDEEWDFINSKIKSIEYE